MGMLNTMKSNKGWMIAGALVGVMAVAGTATAQGGFGRGRGFPMMRVLRHLNLTEEQEVQAVRMRRAMREHRKASRVRMEAALEAVKVELAKPNPDPQVLRRAVDDAAEQMKSGMHKAVDQFLKLHSTFDEEQREQLVRIMDKAKERHQRQRRRFGGEE